jgi:tetratricopeptide (TPR) repeat protein
MKKIYSLFFLLLHLVFISQTKTTDSLRAGIKKDKTDSAKVYHLILLAQELENKESFKTDSVVSRAYKEALEHARTVHSKKLEHLALTWLVSYHRNYMDCVPALQYCRQDSAVVSGMNDRPETEQNLCQLAMVYDRMPGGLPAAERSYRIALKMKEEDKDTSGIIFVLGQMQFLWDHTEEGMVKSMEAYYRMLQIFKTQKNIRKISALYQSLAERFYFDAGNYKKAIEYYLKSLELTRDSTDIWNLAHRLIFLAGAYEESGNYKEAIKYYEKAINADKKGSIITAMHNVSIADCYIKLHDYKKAESYLDKFLKYLDEDSKADHKIKNFNQHFYVTVFLNSATLNELQGQNDEALINYRKAAAASGIVKTENSKGLSETDTLLNPQFVSAYTALGKMFVKLNQKDSAEFYLNIALKEAMMSTDPDYKLETVKAMKQLDSLKGNQNGKYAQLYIQLKSKVDSIQGKKQNGKERINLILLEKEKEYFPGMVSGKRSIQSSKIDFLKLTLFMCLIFLLAAPVIFISRRG